ncbi:GDSL-like Lipase/Acylhydrolase [Luteitalea pratensis]|uniref:GDSL-like Lipase/Acylhydrolase n=1 Tax=Luteitalea pratensis TaxID=1855912 RepID=A0A143PGI5_LUTPR|nr:GDSL-type esterase/lipase family protein [Luteitalea pratensis]AMY07536.1 GDSL-like Lipase/Acylhydrolase [Luteitalea pratensis]
MSDADNPGRAPGTGFRAPGPDCLSLPSLVGLSAAHGDAADSAGSPWAPKPWRRRPSPALTIVALGDSTTAGTPGFRSPLEAPPDGEGDTTSQFTWWLMQAEPAWRVLNRGVNGERTDEIATRFERDVLVHAPDVLILLAGVNDVYQGRDPSTVQGQLLAMYTRALKAGLPTIACSIIPYDTATPDQNAGMHAINTWIRETALSMPGLVFCDTRAAAARPDDMDRLFDTPDRLHPTPEGYRRMADALLEVVRELTIR